ncbi:unnamed protein product [Porites evermanni]|uniref:Metalloendopeptidase n=1 Tax=Porites evermanni TaxID=104178 RepID=A0ABN8PNC2_9CNID|nr:unnamed protein product [Porites evermanni]
MKALWFLFLLPLVGAQIGSHRPEENVGIDDPKLFEGDMILTDAQRIAAMLGDDVSKAGLGRASIRKNLWPGAVLIYQLDPAIERDSRAMAAINKAMELWRTQTCVRFKKRTNENAYVYVHIGSGCTSYVGKTGQRQMLSLARGCWYTATVAHEFGHALGFYHEQSRPDHDDYVIINWNNIQQGLAFAFNKYPRSTIDSLGTPYDYGSVMHYEDFAFSKNRRPTIVAKRQGVTLGNRKGPSTIDVKQMNLLYKCSGGGCDDKNVSCPNWAKKGYCKGRYERWMSTNCPKSCKKC